MLFAIYYHPLEAIIDQNHVIILLEFTLGSRQVLASTNDNKHWGIVKISKQPLGKNRVFINDLTVYDTYTVLLGKHF